MEYTNAWFIQDGITPIDAFTNIDCIAADTNYMNIYSHIYV